MEQPEEINYKELLYHYMAHVIDCESISFVDAWTHSNPEITDNERGILEKIEQEVRNSMYPPAPEHLT